MENYISQNSLNNMSFIHKRKKGVCTPLSFFSSFIFITMLIFSHPVKSQNQILNPSFESYIRLVPISGILFHNDSLLSIFDSSKVVAWSNPSLGSPDYMHTPINPPLSFSAPNTYWGYQYPRSGEAYAHFGSYKDINPSCEFTRREYIQGKLSEPLIAGRNYVFGFYAVLTEISTHASKIGIAFTEDTVYYNTMDCLIGEGFYPNLETSTFITDTANWTKVEWVYTASGGERFFTVGNFWCDSTESFLFVDTVGYTDCHMSSYFVDDFYMYELIDSMAVQDMYIPNIFSPNNDGQNDVFRIRGAGVAEIKQFRIYNRWGEEVFQCRTSLRQAQGRLALEDCGWDGTYHGKDAPVGVYVYYVEVVLLNGETMVKRGNVTLVR